MTVLSGDYIKREDGGRNIVIVLEKGIEEDNPIFKKIWEEIEDYNLKKKNYNIFLAKDFIRVKHQKTEEANVFKVKHNIYAKKIGKDYWLCVGEGRFLNHGGALEAFDMTYPMKTAPVKEIRIDLLVAVKAIPAGYLLATRENGITVEKLIEKSGDFDRIEKKCFTNIISYEEFDTESKVGQPDGKSDFASVIEAIFNGNLEIEESEIDLSTLKREAVHSADDIKEGMEKMGASF